MLIPNRKLLPTKSPTQVGLSRTITSRVPLSACTRISRFLAPSPSEGQQLFERDTTPPEGHGAASFNFVKRRERALNKGASVPELYPYSRPLGLNGPHGGWLCIRYFPPKFPRDRPSGESPRPRRTLRDKRLAADDLLAELLFRT